MKTAWYLGHSADKIGNSAILVGDPARVSRIADLLEAPDFLPETRGLKTVTGNYNGQRVTIAAFGMGAPIATIVLHELAYLGIKTFLRIGTAMYFPPALPGDFVISASALSFEGTSAAYTISDAPPVADPALVQTLVASAAKRGAAPKTGIFATFDAFYRDMFGIDAAGHKRAGETRAMLRDGGVLAADMETSALLTAAEALDVSCASFCLGTVNGINQKKLMPELLAQGEMQMFRIALDAMTAKG
ncbi:nucleoside phosphorylase [Rhodophyticola sp. CCM32]|uniref:nucleoside phosphorylase n=1 Tax=Rhodophyticola sp. CCM32 TaxID=2916397 RepID=UPI001AEFAA49|nr:nucleoside phosphorylase [Rhodophyticola sp. CCM32]